MLSSNVIVGPANRTNNNNIPAKIKFKFVSFFIPLLIPLTAENKNRTVIIAIIVN